MKPDLDILPCLSCPCAKILVCISVRFALRAALHALHTLTKNVKAIKPFAYMRDVIIKNFLQDCLLSGACVLEGLNELEFLQEFTF